MSRTKKVETTENPVQAYISLNGKLGKAGIRKPGEADFSPIELPFNFVVVDADAKKIGGTVGGSQKKDAPRFKSNIAHFGYGGSFFTISTDKDSKVLASGNWGQIKENTAIPGAKFQQLIYAISENGNELVRICLHGRALSRWIEFAKEHPPIPTEKSPKNFMFSIVGFEAMTGGESELESMVPIFSATEIPDDHELVTAAIDCDENILQPWFEHYFNVKKETPESVAEVDDMGF